MFIIITEKIYAAAFAWSNMLFFNTGRDVEPSLGREAFKTKVFILHPIHS